MPKKQVRNAFYFYMKELEPELRREGRVLINGMADVVPIAHPRWKALPEKEKARFEKMSKDYKAKMRGTEGDKYRLDNVGNIIAHRKDPMTELEKRRLAERKQMIANWPPGKELANESFYFINIQYLCETEEGDYIPCEIALIEYSIARGITKKLHRFIEPGRIPTGYRFTCIQHSDDTHMIPVENFELADSNYRGLWIQIENFINPSGEKPEYPPLFCLGAGNDYKVVEYCLAWIHNKACIGGAIRLRKVYEIESLLHEVYVHMGVNVSKSQCIEVLTSTDWDYEADTRCDYHEEKECRYCALGIVQRYAYAMSDCLCLPLFDVKLTEKHLKMRKKLNSVTVLPPSTMPVQQNQNVRLPRKTGQMSQQPVREQPRQPPIKKEVEEEDYTELRRPNIPGFSGLSISGGASTASASPWGGMMGVSGMRDNSGLMPAGRGLSVAMPDTANTKYAGRQAPPDPTVAPAPPLGWQMGAPAHPMMQQPLGVGRGMVQAGGASTVGMQQPRPVQQIPRETYQPPPMAAAHTAEFSSSSTFDTKGRGGGAILTNLMKEGKKPGVPMGRGYAPPGWDDASLELLLGK